MDNLFDATEIRPTIVNLLIFFLFIIIVIPLAKVTFAKFYVRGLSELVAMI